MLLLNNAHSSDPGMPTRAELADLCHWNLWKVRQHPYNAFNEGSHVIWVDSWPGGGRMTWEIEARIVEKQAYTSKTEAARVIAKSLGFDDYRDALDHEYTTSGPPSGYLLAFNFRPVRRIDLPRPLDLRFRQNGWLSVDDPEVLERWGVGKSLVPARGGFVRYRSIAQGRLPVAQRLAVEQRAMEEATKWCRDNGWFHVDYVSSRKSWDLEARKSKTSKPLFVEVKGTTSSSTKVDVTAAEVRHAGDNPRDTALVVVTGITLHDVAGKPRAKGGRLHLWYPWEPRKQELQSIVYRWTASSVCGARTK
jgi:hypothetical protein